MDWKKLTSLDRIVIAAGVLLVIDLLAIPWIDVSVGPISVTSAGTGSPDGFLGVLALLFALGTVLSVVLERFTTVRLPSLPISSGGKWIGTAHVRSLAALVALVLIVLKFVLHLHPSYLGAGCWAALILGIVLVVSTRRSRTEATVQAGRPT
jgi:hypothetical protein